MFFWCVAFIRNIIMICVKIEGCICVYILCIRIDKIIIFVSIYQIFVTCPNTAPEHTICITIQNTLNINFICIITISIRNTCNRTSMQKEKRKKKNQCKLCALCVVSDAKNEQTIKTQN